MKYWIYNLWDFFITKIFFFIVFLAWLTPFILYIFFPPTEDKLSSNRDYGFEDGIYSAEVEYYNPNTETNSTYLLEVEIEDNYLVAIYWPNGGMLDKSHFDPPDISDGEASFVTDRNHYYTVIIVDDECGDDEENYYDDPEDDENELNYDEE